MMSSKNSNIHHVYDPNIKIKEEPGTLCEASASTSPLIPNLIKTVKTEFGIPSNLSTTRLPSFRVPRDLTLGGNVKLEKPRKVYTPNLNAQRNKNREDQNNSNIKSETNLKVNKGRNRDRGKGRGKTANVLVQSAGIFSDGVANTSKRNSVDSSIYKSGINSASGRESITLEIPKLSIPTKIDKVEEANKLRELLRDDFIDDESDLDLENTPLVLPMIDKGTVFKKESSPTTSISKDRNNSVNIQNGEGTLCKKQLGLITPTSEDCQKFVNFQNGEANIQNAKKLIKPQIKIKDEKVPLTVPEVMENKPSTFILMQLPDCLPGLQTDDKPNDPRLKQRTSKSMIQNETDKSNKYCTLNNLKEGMLGKLQILRSGKTRLLLGENDLLIDVGSNLSFRQDLVAVKLSGDKQSGDLVNLGPVNSTLICSPDWENMLKKL